jgi:hypothetical protein
MILHTDSNLQSLLLVAVFLASCFPLCVEEGATAMGQSISSPKFSCGMGKIRLNNRFGFVDHFGQVVIDSAYENAANFSEGVAAVSVNGKWGYVRTDGSMAISFQFEKAFDFVDGVALVMNAENKLYGFIDQSGVFTVPPKYRFAYSFSEGLAYVEANEQHFFIDRNGKRCLELKNAKSFAFSEGLAMAKTLTTPPKVGFVDKSGNWAIEAKFDCPKTFFGGGFSEGLCGVLIGSKFGFIDHEGKVVVDPKFDNAGDFRQGIARVIVDGEVRYIDRNGKHLFGRQFRRGGSFFEGLAGVTTHEGVNKFIRLDGTTAFEYESMAQAYNFSEGLCLITEGSESSYFDRFGRKKSGKEDENAEKAGAKN